MDGEPIDVASSSAKDNGVLCYLGLVYVPHARNTRSLRFFRELQQDDADGFIYIRVQQFIPPVICSICTYTEALELNGLRLSIGHENRGSGWDVNNHQLPSLLGSSLLDPDVPAFPMTYIHYERRYSSFPIPSIPFAAGQAAVAWQRLEGIWKWGCSIVALLPAAPAAAACRLNSRCLRGPVRSPHSQSRILVRYGGDAEIQRHIVGEIECKRKESRLTPAPRDPSISPAPGSTSIPASLRCEKTPML
jgi:hypothetical protein